MTICKGNKRSSGPSEDETLDVLFHGKLKIFQGRSGYRFSLDAVLLAHFAKPHGNEKIIDLGTGNGIIPLMIVSLHSSVRVVGLELQEKMVGRALRSVALNRYGERVKIIQGDVRSIKEFFSAQSFDAVLCNPPYRRRASGRMNPDPEKCAARHEISGCLADFIRAGAYLIKAGGRMALVYPATRMVDLLQAMRQAGMEPKRLRLVHSFAGSGAALVLAEGIKGAGSELKLMPPLIVYTSARQYSPEMKTILGE